MPHKKSKTKLSAKTALYKKFALAWVETGSATAAAIAAGYSKLRAGRTGYELLQHPEVQAEIARLQEDVAKAAGITPVMIARKLAAIAFSDIRDHVKWGADGKISLVGSDAAHPDDPKRKVDTRAIAEVSEGADGRIKIKLHDAKGALDSLNKMLGFNAVEKQELTLNKNHEEALDELS